MRFGPNRRGWSSKRPVKQYLPQLRNIIVELLSRRGIFRDLADV